MLQSLNYLHGPLGDSVQYAHVSLVLRAPDWDTAPQMCLTRAKQMGMFTSLDLLVTRFLMQPRRRLANFLTRIHPWIVVS